MKILFLGFYYPPDLSAGSFRSSSLVEALLKNSSKNVVIDLITTFPNRYNSFKTEACELEVLPKIRIRRIRLPVHKNGILDQSIGFITFARLSFNFIDNKEYDLVYATSSRLMTAFLGFLIAKKHQTPLYLDIRDIFTESIKDVLPKFISPIIMPFVNFIENKTFHYAHKINLVSEGFLPYFQKKYPKQNYSFYTNGIDEELISYPKRNNLKNKNQILTVVYAGNFGDGQGLHHIIPKLAKIYEGKLIFKLIGDGSCRKKLENRIFQENCKNVEIISPIKRSELKTVYDSTDIFFLHLNDYPAFEKVLPSKLFEYGALGKPIWAGIAGYAAEFAKANLKNIAIFRPCNVEDAENSFKSLKILTKKRTKFIRKFSRKEIMKQMSDDILGLVSKKDY